MSDISRRPLLNASRKWLIVVLASAVGLGCVVGAVFFSVRIASKIQTLEDQLTDLHAIAREQSDRGSEVNIDDKLASLAASISRMPSSDDASMSSRVAELSAEVVSLRKAFTELKDQNSVTTTPVRTTKERLGEEFAKLVKALGADDKFPSVAAPLALLVHVDERKRSLLHYAAELGVSEIFEPVSAFRLPIRKALSGLDVEGNSPVHLAPINSVTWSNTR